MPTLGNYASNSTIYLDDDAYLVDDDITLAVYFDDDAIIFPPTYFPFSTPIKEMRASCQLCELETRRPRTGATVCPFYPTPPSTYMLLCLLLPGPPIFYLHLSTVPTCLILLANAGAYSLALPSLSEG